MLEIIAMISMFLDHIGLYIFNNNFVLRIIGRLALPIYGYLIIQGKDKTKDINKYIIRLFIIAIISQIPFYLLGNKGLNIVFTYVAYVGISTLRDKKLRFISIILLMVVSTLIIDYGMYAVLYLLIMDNSQRLLKLLGLNMLYTYIGWTYQGFSLIAYIPIKIYEKHKIRLPDRLRYIYRVFYPLHLLLILFIKLLIK